MEPEQPKRKLAAILCAGAEGYSRLMGEDESGTLTTLKAHLQLIGSLSEKHGGRVMAIHGDTLLAGFDSVVDAMQCAVEIQNELMGRNEKEPEGSRMPFRIGINLGDVIEERGNVYGNGVNVAAGVKGLADPGPILRTGGVSASFAGLADIMLAEPGARIGFAGPRVIEATMSCTLPPDFQDASRLMANGFIDMIVHRHRMREVLAFFLKWFS